MVEVIRANRIDYSDSLQVIWCLSLGRFKCCEFFEYSRGSEVDSRIISSKEVVRAGGLDGV